MNGGRQGALKSTVEDDTIPIKRSDLVKEHDLLIARLHHLRRLLGYPQLWTGRQKRKAREVN